MAHTLKLEVVSGEIRFIRKQLSAAELYPVNQRYNDATDTVQYTPDGGATWIDANNLDPRNQTNIPPRTTGTSIPCAAAESVAEYFKRYVALVVSVLRAGALAVQLATSIVAFLEIVGGEFAILWELITAVSATLAATGANDIEAAFDDTIWHTFVCILACRMDTDGQLNATTLGEVESDIDAQIGSTAGTVLKLMLSIMGFAGVNKSGTFYTLTEDCGDCGCDWCHEFDFTADDGGFFPYGLGAVYVPSSGWSTTDNYAGGAYSRIVEIEIDFPSCEITEVSMVYTGVNGGSNFAANWWSIQADPLAACTSGNGNLATATNARLTCNHAGSADKIKVWMRSSHFSSNTFAGSVTLKSVRVKGTGYNPFGTTNC